MRIRQSCMPGPLSAVAAFSLAVLVSACSVDHPCSAGEEFRDGYCYPTDAGQSDASLAGADDSGGGGSFGAACSSTTDCAAPATFCAPNPLAYCTAFGCDTDPSVCPAGWTCLDLSNFGASGHMCLRP
jgi:hypothetical protein